MLTLTSRAFENGGFIPARYTADGANTNPPLTISGVPKNAVSLVLIIDDPDAATDPDGPGKTFDHWVLFNIPPSYINILENSVPKGAVVGLNSIGTNSYIGPAPPNGVHKYRFKLFALDTRLDRPPQTTKEELEQAMAGHIIDQSELTSKYRRA